MVLQAVWQGLVNSIASLGLMTYTLRRLGAQVTALFSALVPLLTTLLAIPLLLEIPTAGQWAGVVIVAAGMLGAALL